ncbi:hypothetical protein Q3G72_017396 [Acer saccharum]|nr:hypothetical protein Q3G72_017396 [Acer saccharum]
MVFVYIIVSKLEGDDSYSCWRAYFELKELERATPKEDIDKLILQAGDGLLKSLEELEEEPKKPEEDCQILLPLNCLETKESSLPVSI